MPEVTANPPSSTARKPPPAKPAPAEPPAPETLEWAEPVLAQPPRSKGPMIVAVTATLLALGLGYVATEQWQAGQRTLATLTKTRAQVQALSLERTRLDLGLREQKTLVAQQKQRIDLDASELSDQKAKLGAAEARLNELETQSEALAEHVAEFRGLTKQFQRMIDAGKLQISFRRGRMIVELPAAVLFASGSAELSPDGKQALLDIAKILRKVPGKRFMVGGHTDDVPIGKGTAAFSSNWSLSAARAVRVTESLIDAGMRANHLVAAGYGEYDPIASNANEKGRTKNRRIEIVLEPELGALPAALAELKKDAPATKTAAKATRTSKR
jgi:chemotaxis protein MotB